MARVNSVKYKQQNMVIWNEVAPRYHKRWASSNTGPFQSTKKLVELVNVKKGNKILDVACGTGVVTKMLGDRIGDTGYVIGVDTSITAIKIAKKINCKPNINFVNADAEKFSFKEKFDIITCQYGLFFFPNAKKALRNMKNSLKDAGILGISVHGHKDSVPFFGSILDAVTKFIPDYVPPGTPSLDRYGTKKTLSDEVKNVGFTNVSIKDFVFKYSPGNFDNYWTDYLKYVAKPIKQKLNTLEKSQKMQLKEAVRENTEKYTKRNGIIQFPWEVLILTAKN